MTSQTRPNPQRSKASTRAFERILVVDDEQNIRFLLEEVLTTEGYEVVTAGSGDEALEKMGAAPCDLVLSDVRMPGMDGLTLLERLLAIHPEVVVIIMSAYGNVDSALSAIKAGAYDYLSKPFKPAEAVLAIRKADERERLKQENRSLRSVLNKSKEGGSLGKMVAQSAPMQDLFRTIRKVAEYKSTVLISGESGTGKELVARALHDLSPRAKKSFIAVNCGAIPEALLESELFGHRRGAFTDATSDKNGLFWEANQGTLFLDEIGELPLVLQVKLLRVLQEEEIRRVGDARPIKVDVRVIAATVRNLQKEVDEGRFRQDLFYRLNVLPVTLPALRERMEDVPPLIAHFVERNNVRLGMSIAGVVPSAMKSLMAYRWPGNVRELENTVEHAMVLAESEMIDLDSLPPKLRVPENPVQRALASGDLSIKRASRHIEEELIRRALTQTGGNRTSASKLLEISHRALLYKIKEYGIEL
jgi:two-component system response regulator AtoC